MHNKGQEYSIMNKEDINIHKYNATLFEKEHLPFTQICNKVIQNITNIQAGFIWVYLQSLPATWIPNKFHLMSHFGISERTYQRIMSYLSDCKLVSYERDRKPNGTLAEVRLIVHNGINFTQAPPENHTAKIVSMVIKEKPLPDKDSDHTAKFGIVDFNHTAKKPHSGDLAPFINKECFNNKETMHTQEQFFLEKNLFSDSEQQRKAIVMRELCLSDAKAKAKYFSLETDKTFIEVLDECVSHYATLQSPLLVSPQRLQSWINRDIRFQKKQNMTSPLSKYPTKQQREEENEKIKKRESEAAKIKKLEIDASKNFKGFINKLKTTHEERIKNQQVEREKLGMTVMEYHEHITRNKFDTEQNPAVPRTINPYSDLEDF